MRRRKNTHADNVSIRVYKLYANFWEMKLQKQKPKNKMYLTKNLHVENDKNVWRIGRKAAALRITIVTQS